MSTFLATSDFVCFSFFFFQAEDGIRDLTVTGVQTCALPISDPAPPVFAEVRAEVEAGVPGALAKLQALAEANHAQAQLYLAQLYDGGEAGLPQKIGRASCRERA